MHKEARDQSNVAQLTVMALAATALTASQITTDQYDAVDIIMAIISFLVLFCVKISDLNKKEICVFASVFAFAVFHSLETMIAISALKYPCVSDQTEMSFLSFLIFVVVGVATALYLNKKKK